ncbi:MAG: hypothetical protein Q7V01_12425 [Vicinamibacterales bacterium]|nr:hypothetical protein [Vicinamibacterales bacterium]
MTVSPFSHPDAGVRHSYPLAIQQAGFSTAASLVARTLPYALVRFGILVGFTVVTVIWFGATFGLAALLGAAVHPWVGIGTFIVGAGAYGYAWFIVVRYALYLIQAGHVAVLTELVTRGEMGNGSEGLFVYGKRIVTERFGQVNLLFALDLLIRGVVGAFNRTLNFVAGLLPIPGLQSVMGIVNAVVRAATSYIDETIFSYNLARGDENAWRSSKDALIYYAQNSKEILKTAVWVVVIDKVLTAVVWAVMLAPAFLMLAILPESAKPGGFIGGLVIAALLASNVRQAFLKPIFLVMVMTKFHVLVQNQPINLEWDQRLSSVSRKFGEIKDKAAGAPGLPVPDSR